MKFDHWTVIHLHPWNPALHPKSNGSILFLNLLIQFFVWIGLDLAIQYGNKEKELSVISTERRWLCLEGNQWRYSMNVPYELFRTRINTPLKAIFIELLPHLPLWLIKIDFTARTGCVILLGVWSCVVICYNYWQRQPVLELLMIFTVQIDFFFHKVEMLVIVLLASW